MDLKTLISNLNKCKTKEELYKELKPYRKEFEKQNIFLYTQFLIDSANELSEVELYIKGESMPIHIFKFKYSRYGTRNIKNKF